MEMINYICMIAFTVPDAEGKRRVEAEINVKFRASGTAKGKDRCKTMKKEAENG